MITYRTRGLTLIYSLAMAVSTGVVFWLWLGLFFGVFRMASPVSVKSYAVYSALIVGGFLIDYLFSKLDRLDLTKLDFPAAIRLAARQTVTCVLVICLYLVVSRDAAISRLFFLSFIPLLFGVLIGLNRVLPKLLGAVLFPPHRQMRTLIWGNRGQVSRVTRWLENKSHYGIQVIGVVSDDEMDGLPWRSCGRSDAIWEIVASSGATQLMLLEMPDSISEAARIAAECENLGVRLTMINDAGEHHKRPLHYSEEDGVQMIGFRDEPLECPFNRATKRALDLALAIPVITFILPPLALLVHLFQRWQSPGPLFCRQIRTGIYSKSFSIWKFRTMHMSDGPHAVQATTSDSRIYAAGRWLRKLSLDEIPQFLNVLLGDMSVVGPRPHLLEHDTQFGKLAASYRVRSLVKPGITGWAQVQGQRGEIRESEDIINRVRSDVYYLENWSFALDWVIILQTIWHVVHPPKTAY